MKSVKFVKSSPDLQNCPETDLPEIAFIGRSNVGKSSLINYLTNVNNLAKVSTKPGKTRLLNYFLVDEKRFLVDLPGYGYAKASINERRKWIDTLYQYFTKRNNLKLIFLLIDAKIPVQKIDIEFLNELFEEKLPFAIIMTKTDKTNQKLLNQNIKNLKTAITNQGHNLPEILQSSSTKKKGKEKILELVDKFTFDY